MSPLPAQFTGRWEDNRTRPSYNDAVCWHLLLGGHAEVRAAAADARQRLTRFAGLHMTPPQWLHVTILRAGITSQITPGDMELMLTRAQADLTGTPPVTITLQRVLYHPQAIALCVSPSSALAPILAAARTATREALGADAAGDGYGEGTIPHLTLCYSTTEQPAAPVIAALGKNLPSCRITVDRLSLVVQHGPEYLWDWQVAGTARLLGASQHAL